MNNNNNNNNNNNSTTAPINSSTPPVAKKLDAALDWNTEDQKKLEKALQACPASLGSKKKKIFLGKNFLFL